MLGDNAMKNWLRGKKMSLLQMKFNSIKREAKISLANAMSRLFAYFSATMP